MDTLLPAIADAAFDRLKDVLDNLGATPPQVLLLEGGSEAQRMDARVTGLPVSTARRQPPRASLVWPAPRACR